MTTVWAWWRRLRVGWVALLVGVALPAVTAWAGSEATRVGVDKYGDEAIRDLALRVNDALDARKVNLAIIARCGRDRSALPRGVRYTHVGFVLFEAVRGADGEVFHTYTTYNLYQGLPGAEDTSYLKQDVTYDFVASVAEPDVAICVPTEALQRRILAVIRSPTYQALHNPRYNLVANPWRSQFDNCVTHLLRVCVAGIYRTDDAARIQENLRTYFRPTPIRLGPLQAFGSHFLKAISHDDREPGGPLQTATYDSVVTFLRENGLVQETFTVRVQTPALSES